MHRGQRKAWGVLLYHPPLSFEAQSLTEIGTCVFDSMASSQQALEIILHLSVPLSAELQVCVRLHLAPGWDLTASPLLVNKSS